MNDVNDVNDIFWERDAHFVLTGLERGGGGGNENIKKVFFYLGEYNTINKSEHLSDTNIRCQFNINCHNSMINTMKADICLVMSESSL